MWLVPRKSHVQGHTMPVLGVKENLEVEMPKLLLRETQTPSCVQEPGLVTARENTARPWPYKSQVNETVGARGQILTMKSGLWGHFSH